MLRTDARLFSWFIGFLLIIVILFFLRFINGAKLQKIFETTKQIRLYLQFIVPPCFRRTHIECVICVIGH